jgi:PhnB protein
VARVSTYLNFAGNTEQVFEFYRSVFKTEYKVPISRFGDMPAMPGNPSLSPSDAQMVMHVELPILGGHSLMGTDAPESMGFSLNAGNNVSLSLEPDSRSEAERLFKELSINGKVDMPLADAFWGAYFASFTDQFGIKWMINCTSKD